MSRQINLYTPAFRRRPKLFSALWTVAAAVLIVAGALAYYAWEDRQVKDLRTRRIEAEAQLKQLREQLVGLGKTAQKPRSKALEEQVARAEALLKSRQELFGELQSGEIGNREGYSKYLVALARQHVEGVWLTGIEISGSHSDLTIEGRTVRADLLSEYIKLLRREEALRGKSIGTLALHEREVEPITGQKAQPVAAEAAGGIAKAQGVSGPARTAVRLVEFKIGASAAPGPGGAHQ